MRCKFCGAELMEDTTVCAECGKDNAKDSLDILQKKVKTMRTALLILLAAALIAAVVAVVVISVWGGMDQEEEPETQPSTQATVPADGNPDDQTCKGSYTATDDQVIANHDTVVATMGDTTITNGEFVIYYWNAIFDFLSEYGSYAVYFGLDVSQPLDTQACTMYETNMTWQQSFVMEALNTWKTYQSVASDAEKAGFTLPVVYAEILNDLRNNLETTAEQNEFESVDAMLAADYGPGCTYEDYYSYMKTYYMASAYYEHLMNTLDVTETEIQEFYEKNKETLSTNYSITNVVVPLISVRHILIPPESSTSSSTYTDAEWEACRVKAQGIYDAWLAGDKSEKTFIEAAKENSKDGSAQEGGLYEDVYANLTVKEFNDWCFDASRKFGDHGLVKTQYGYHIMFFVDSYTGTHPAIISGIRSEKVSGYLEDLGEACKPDVDYKQILVSAAQLVG